MRYIYAIFVSFTLGCVSWWRFLTEKYASQHLALFSISLYLNSQWSIRCFLAGMFESDGAVLTGLYSLFSTNHFTWLGSRVISKVYVNTTIVWYISKYYKITFVIEESNFNSILFFLEVPRALFRILCSVF